MYSSKKKSLWGAFLKLLFILFSTFLFDYSFSNIPKLCIDIVRDLNKKAKESYIHLLTFIEIEKIFNENTSASHRAQKLFDLVLRDRITTLSPEIKNKIKQLLKKRVLSNKDTSVTFYNQETDTIHLKNDFPEIEPNYIYYASFIHEVEHALQNYLLHEKVPKLKAEAVDTVGLRTQQEIGAMLLEYDYIRMVPESERKKAFEEAQKNMSQDISESEKKYFKTLLLGTYSKPIDYIKAHQREGRYSVESIEKFFESFGH
jgi:hypothetical protein